MVNAEGKEEADACLEMAVAVLSSSESSSTEALAEAVLLAEKSLVEKASFGLVLLYAHL